MIPKNFILVAAALVALGALGAVAAALDDRGHEAVSQATAGFGDVAAAQASGYGVLPEAGRACVRYVNAGLASDPSVDARTPEALLYERLSDGRLELAGVEYIVLQSAWDAQHNAPPSLFNRRFALVGAGQQDRSRVVLRAKGGPHERQSERYVHRLDPTGGLRVPRAHQA